MGLTALLFTVIAAVLYGVGTGRPRLTVVARALTFAAAALLFAQLVVGSVAIGFPALVGGYGGFLLLALALLLAPAIGQRSLFRNSTPLLAATLALAVLLLALLSSPLIPADLAPPVPVLRSAWLVLHVGFAFVGIALFTVAAVAAVAGMVMRNSDAADRLRDDVVPIGFVCYAVGGLVFGAVWAESAWGRFWGWDPKETWALITTLAWSVYLHLRYIRKVRLPVRRIAALVSWAIAVFTYVGVNTLMTGLHAYG